MPIFATPPKSPALERRLTELDEQRRYLARHLGESAQPWTGALRRLAAAETSGGSAGLLAGRAARGHLTLVSINPFREGKGGVARVVQSMVLAKEGLLRPEFVPIEPFLARHTREYYSVLEEVQGPGFDPAGDASPWVEFCIEAHVRQATERRGWLELAHARADFC